MRWIYAPHQRRYLYCAFFFFGLSATIHQILAGRGDRDGNRHRLHPAEIGAGFVFWQCPGVAHSDWARKTGTWTSFAQATDMVPLLINGVGVGSAIACAALVVATRGLLTEIVSCIWMGLLWLAGASFYFYEAIAGMTNPPMEWGYPRTVEGFFHALTRGQYDKINPTDFLHDPHRLFIQLLTLAPAWRTPSTGFTCFSPCCRFCFSSKCSGGSGVG